jgi:BirA family biotin operon repressor/biotin-[acetyl-CoA-carboxylase] ligase
MIYQQDLLTLLSDGEWHSGEDLGRHFAVSRAAIWKQLQQLQVSGITLLSERGKGYRLASPINLLTKDVLYSGLTQAAQSLLGDLRVEFSVESTNTQVMDRIISEPSPCNGCVVFAEQQTAGRGRRGRPWISPLGQNIYCSLNWGFTSGAASLSGLSLAIGLATVKALESLGYQGISLKWPNDLLWQGRKLGGILLEIAGDLAGPCQVVIGIGLNVTMSQQGGQGSKQDEADMAPTVHSIDQPWVDLYEIDSQLADKNCVAAAMLNELLPLLADFEVHGFLPLKTEWLSRDAFLDQPVVLHMGDQQVQGVSKGVTDDGSLYLETAAGLQSYNGGEVSLRMVAEAYNDC